MDKDGFFGFMNRVGDTVFLNVVFLLTILPIITIGPALVALYTVSMRIHEGTEGYVVRAYFKCFRENIKNGMLFGVPATIVTMIAIIAYGEMQYSDEYAIPRVVTLIALILIYVVSQYAIPLIGRYENDLITTLINAFLIALAKLPYTLLIAAILWVQIIFIGFIPFLWVYVIFAFFSVTAQLQSIPLAKVFDSFEGNDNKSDEVTEEEESEVEK